MRSHFYSLLFVPAVLCATSQAHSSHQKRAGCTQYMALLNEPIKQDDQAAIDDLVGFLGNQVDKQDAKEFNSVYLPGDMIGGWGNLLLTENGLNEIRKPGGKFKGARGDCIGEYSAIPKLSKRAPAGWKKQRDKPLGLAEISVPKDKKIDDFGNFVYENRAGKDITIYVIDSGVNINVKNNREVGDDHEREFPNSRAEMTEACEREPTNCGPADQDASVAMHGTKVASKALGQRYGVAKGANLVSIKTAKLLSDMVDAFALIEDDMANHGINPAKTVILSSLGDTIPEKADKNNAALRVGYEMWCEFFIGQGVPIVFAAGNERHGDERKDIDMLPGTIQSESIPIRFNVGAANLDGTQHAKSQGGTQLTIYAPGEKIELQSKVDKEVKTDEGTSFAAPAVAGLIATYMAYDPPPWKEGKDVSGLDRVRNIIKHITGTDSSWARAKDINMIWNGATEDDHKNAEPEEGGDTGTTCKRDGSGECPISLPKCNGYAKDGKDRYVSGDEISRMINEDFCPKFNNDVGGTELAKQYFTDTPDEFSIEFRTDDENELPNPDICSKHLNNIVGNCDKDMPMNWKGGGDFKIGNWYWNIYPTHDRPTADFLSKPKGWCTVHGDYTVQVWGGGWENSGFGAELQKAFTDFDRGDWKPVFFMDGWTFNYELENGHEWRAFLPQQLIYNTWEGLGQNKDELLDGLKDNVENVMRSVADYDGFEVNCDIAK